MDSKNPRGYELKQGRNDNPFEVLTEWDRKKYSFHMVLWVKHLNGKVG